MPVVFGDNGPVFLIAEPLGGASNPSVLGAFATVLRETIIAAGLAFTSPDSTDTHASRITSQQDEAFFLGAGARELGMQINQIMTHASLQELGSLANDWDGYGAPPIAPEIIAAASAFINDYGAEFQGVPSVVPMTKGRLQFEWHRGKRSLEIEFENPRSIHYLKWDSSLGIEDENITSASDKGAITSLLRWFSSEKRNAHTAGSWTSSTC